jgi:hypothetical protein
MTDAARRTNPARAAAALAAAAFLVAGTACHQGEGVTLESVHVSPDPLYLAVGHPQQLTLVGHYSDGRTAELRTGVVWTSTLVATAAVDGKGVVTPLSAGQAQITATYDPAGLSVTIDVTSRVVVFVDAEDPLPLHGAVDTTATYFRVSGLAPGTMYSPAVYGMSDDVDLAVYADASLAPEAELCRSESIGRYDESCVAPASAAGDLWIVVDGQWTRDGATFALDLPETEPVELADVLAYPEELPRSGEVGVEKRYLEIVGLAPGTAYEVRISGLTADVDLAVWADPYTYALLCESYAADVVEDFCVATAGESGTFFVELDGQTSRYGGPWTLALTVATPTAPK